MKTRIGLNFRLLYHCTVLSLITCSILFGVTYLGYILMSGLFSSLAVFSSVFSIAVGLGVYFLYDTEAFQWDNNPRIVIKPITEVSEDE